VRGIKDTDDMFWRYEQHDRRNPTRKADGYTTCEAVVYDWPLLQVGYIERRRDELYKELNPYYKERAAPECKQCPDNSVLVGSVLNADPYGIALPGNHSLYELMAQASLKVQRTTDFYQALITDHKLSSYKKQTDITWSVDLWRNIGYVFAGVVGVTALWIIAFRTCRNKLDIESIEKELKDADTTQYIHEEVNLLDSSQVHLSEAEELTHEIRLELNKIMAMSVELLRKFQIKGLSHPDHNIYEHGRHVPESDAIRNLFLGRSSSIRAGAGSGGATSGQGGGVAGWSAPPPPTGPPRADEARAGALPPGWEATLDPQTGRTYYRNHNTQETQWDHP